MVLHIGVMFLSGCEVGLWFHGVELGQENRPDGPDQSAIPQCHIHKSRVPFKSSVTELSETVLKLKIRHPGAKICWID